MGNIPRSVALKFARVGEHRKALDDAIKDFLATDPYGARREVEHDGYEHVFYWTKYQKCPDIFGLIAGDAIHNLRSSLDHMAVALAIEGAKISGKSLSWSDLKKLQFPIFVDEPANFAERVSVRRLRDVVTGAVDAIESFQPYNADPEAPGHSPLAMLSSLDNSDKHSVLTTAAMAPVIEKILWDPEASAARIDHPEDLRNDEGAEIGRFVFASPRRAEDLSVGYRWQFVLMQGPMWSLIDIREVIRSFDQKVRAIAWRLSLEFMPPFGETPTPLDDTLEL